MELCFVLIKKLQGLEVFGLLIGIPLILIINGLLGFLFKIIFDEVVRNQSREIAEGTYDPEENAFTFSNFLKAQLWGVGGTLFLMYLLNLWSSTGPR